MMNTVAKQPDSLGKAAASDTLKALVLMLPLLLKLSVSTEFFINCLVVFAVVAFWQWVFAHKRHQQMGLDWLFPATLLCLLLPVAANYWQVALVASFGMVIGEHIYGGRGYSFLSPVLVALALLFYSFQFTGGSDFSAAPQVLSYLSLVFILFPIPVLIFYRALDWLSLCAIIAGFVGVLFFTGSVESIIPTTSAVACVLYCSCDPQLCPKNLVGRVSYGLLVGVLLTLLDPGIALIEKTVFACLLGSITAPLLDQLGQSLTDRFNRTTTEESQHV